MLKSHAYPGHFEPLTAVLCFAGADLGQTNFEYALFGKEDIKRVCQNPTLEEDSREQIGCPY